MYIYLYFTYIYSYRDTQMQGDFVVAPWCYDTCARAWLSERGPLIARGRKSVANAEQAIDDVRLGSLPAMEW